MWMASAAASAMAGGEAPSLAAVKEAAAAAAATAAWDTSGRDGSMAEARGRRRVAQPRHLGQLR